MPNDDKEFIIPLEKFPNLLKIAQIHDSNVTPWSRFKESVIDLHTEGIKKQKQEIEKIYTQGAKHE